MKKVAGPLLVSVFTLSFHALSGCAAASKPVPLVPRIEGESWTIAGDPDLGIFTSSKQQPVDFAVWQAADGTWQLCSCIRKTKCGGETRLLYRWEGLHLTDRNWKPMGIFMQADPKFGETPGGLQAPFVTKIGNAFHMFYGDWCNICIARSKDGKSFERWLYKEPRASVRAASRPGETTLPGLRAGMFSEGQNAGTRDPMALRFGDQWHCYYTACPERVGSVYCRTSRDLRQWSESKIVARGGRTGTGPWSAECPFVMMRDGYFYLFRTQHYGKEAKCSVYRSQDPMDFGVDNDDHFVCELPVAAPEIIRDGNRYFIASLLPSLKGIQVARLSWQPGS